MDDFLITGMKEAEVAKTLNYLLEFLNQAGFLISEKKSSTQPVKELSWLGYKLKPNRLELNEEKQTERQELYVKVLSSGKVRHILTYLGKAIHEARIAKGVVGWIRQLLASIP
jgi:hypothetical protein